MDDVRRLFTGEGDLSQYTTVTTRTYDSPWSDQHPAVMQNFAANILDAEPLVAPVDDGIHGVRLANAIHLSGWTGEEVSITDFDEERYLSRLNRRIADEGLFAQREVN